MAEHLAPSQTTISPATRTVFRLAALFTLLAVVMGSVVCATESGAACPTWPGCHVDQLAPGWHLNPIIEFTHRVVAILAGPLVLAAAILSRRVPGRDRRIRMLPWVALTGAMAAGVFGRIVVVGHLPMVWGVVDLACALVAMLAMTAATVAIERGGPRRATHVSRRAWGAAGTLIGMHLLGIVVAGALTSGALSYTRCVGWPVAVLAGADRYPALQLVRGLLGVTVLALIYGIVTRTRGVPAQRRLGTVVAALVLLEFVLGVAIRTIGLSSGLAAAFSVTAVLLLWTLGLTAARTEDVIVEPELQAPVARV